MKLVTIKKTHFVTFLCTTLLICSCATTDANQTRVQGTGTGAAVGALLGALIGGDAKSAAIGAAIGGAFGAVYAEGIVKKKEEYARQEDYLTDVIRQSEYVTNKVNQDNKLLVSEINTLDKSVNHIKENLSDRRAAEKELKKRKKQLSQMVSQSQTMLDRINQEIEFQNHVLREEEQSAPSELVMNVALGINTLDLTKHGLELQLARLEQIDQRMAF